MFKKIKQWFQDWKNKRKLKKLKILRKRARSFINKTSKSYIYSCIQI